ncbi:MAG: hypothetical protein ACR2MP_10855 [Streptosporangiaceae bacterium]
MPNSNGRTAFGRRSGTVTVIEEPVRRNAARTAKIVFYVVWITVGLLAATVAASKWHPIIALFAGAVIGAVTGLITAAFIIAWPVLRALWWWLPELITATALAFGWIQLAQHTTLAYRLGAVAVITGVPAVIPPVRRYLIATAWCLIVRHRLRTCFSEFIITNRTGSLPLILWARPTPAGVRTWVWLRPGLALSDVQDRLDLLAVACWSASVTAEAASQTNAAYIRLDIKLRDALTATVKSPLLGLVTHQAPPPERDDMPVPTALDLPDVHATDVVPARTPRADRAPAPHPAIKPVKAASPGDDIEDWI